jgi:hypothetical protein
VGQQLALWDAADSRSLWGTSACMREEGEDKAKLPALSSHVQALGAPPALPRFFRTDAE